MHQIQLIDPVKDPRWDPFVINHPYGCIGHTAAWKQVLENSFRQMQGYYFALVDDKTERIKAALPVYLIRSWITGKRLVSIPFTTLCDPLATDDSQISCLLEEAKQLAEHTKCSNIEIVSFLNNNLIEKDDFAAAKRYVTHELSLKPPIENIKSNLHAKSVRYSIRRAKRNNFSIKKCNDDLHMEAFYRLYEMTRKRLCLPVHPFIFFKNVVRYLSLHNNLRLMLVYKDSNPIAGLLCFMFKNRFSVEYSGWDRNYERLCPNHLLWWEAIKDAQLSGYKIFDFGRTSLSNQNLMAFKNRWGGLVKNIVHFRYPETQIGASINQENSIKYAAVKKVCQLLPDSGFKLFSSFCYRHIG